MPLMGNRPYSHTSISSNTRGKDPLAYSIKGALAADWSARLVQGNQINLLPITKREKKRMTMLGI